MRNKILKIMAAFMAAAVISGCAQAGVVAKTAKLELPEKVVTADVGKKGEFPAADEQLPIAEKKEDKEKKKAEKEAEKQAKAEQKAKEKAEKEAQEKAEAEAKAKAEAEASAKAQAEAEAKAKAEAEAAAKAQAEAEAKAKAEAEAAAKAQAEAEAKAKAEAEAQAAAAAKKKAQSQRIDMPDEVRAVWISYLDFYTLAQNKSKSVFTSNMDNAFENIADMGMNTVFVQVRPFGDAMYDSDIFPWSYVMTKTEGVDPGYDPLEIMVELAKEHNLRIEAWINPYRVRAAGSTQAVSSSNPAIKAVKNGSGMAIQYDGGLFYNPASEEARQLITDGVVEIIENYDVDGIHFDDYFYPTTDMSFDSKYYKSYRSAGGNLSQADWRRDNVNKLIRKVYSAVKATDPSVIFGISPQARMDNNYNGQFADVEKWLSNDGYVDYICPQIYYGFKNSTVPYEDSLNLWNKMAKAGGVDLYIGLAVYKCGVTDKWAGSGVNEWVNSTSMMQRMVESAREKSAYEGFVLYRYDSMFNPERAVKNHIAAEMDNLLDIL